MQNSDEEIVCFLPSEEDRIKFNKSVFKLSEMEDSWCCKTVEKIKYQTSIQFNIIRKFLISKI